MSEKYSESQSVLVPRSGDEDTRRVEVWNLTNRVDDRGRRIAVAQVPELKGEKYGYASKALSEMTLSSDGQAKLAEELATDRINVPERREISPEAEAKCKRDLGIEAVEDVVMPLGYNAAEQQPDVEKEKNPHLERVFAPLVRPEIPESKNTGYDYLFGNEEELAVGIAARDSERADSEPLLKAQQEYDRYTTDDTREIATNRLGNTIRHDEGLGAILERFSFKESSLAAVDALRTSKDIRYEVGIYLLDKLNRAVERDPQGYGSRLVANGEKTSDAHSMFERNIPSREFAVLLALAKLDGSFNGDKERATDGVRFDSNGRIDNAQHRDAADSLL